MTEILIAILNMSISASIVAIAVILLRFPLKKAPKIFSYALWIAVFLRLICPFNFESPASLMPTTTEVISPAIGASTTPQINGDMVVVDEPVTPSIERILPQVSATSINSFQVVLTISTYIWLSGLFLLVLYGVISYIRMKHLVYDATMIQDNIFETDKIPTAFVLGFINPKIYLPTIVKGRQFDYILKHEQVHIQRFDYLIKPFAFFLLAIHWFNPIVWLSYYFMSKDMEMSCDEAVLQNSADDIRQDYSISLINLYAENPRLLNPLAFGESSYKNMRVRIKNVLDFSKTPRWVIIVCSIVLMLFMAGFTTNPPQSLIVDAPDNRKELPIGTYIADQDKATIIVKNATEIIITGPKEISAAFTGKYIIKGNKLFLTLTLAEQKDYIFLIKDQALVLERGEWLENWVEQGAVFHLSKEQNSKNQYAIYEQYGLTYRANEDKLYYKDQIVRYFIDTYHNGQGILNMWGHDPDGTIDLHTIRNNADLQGELTGIEAYSQEDFNLRTKEIEAEKKEIPNYDILTFQFRKNEAPDSLQLWIRQCEDGIFDFNTTQQNGRYYIYVRNETEFSFSVTVDGDKANMQISHIDNIKGDGYALFSVPLYKNFTVNYNGETKSFLQ